PGAVKCEADQTFSFHNNSVANCVEDFDTVIAFLKNINPALKILLTVSPVPLIATYENQHVLVSNTISKSILRVSANEISKKYDFVEYFPSFEI
ncbi:GSCFA domain-containing protein, partial [Alkalihalobacillus clausii]|uniref:GSCFA domain-containing protein n=1 Tax=Shouchella clausii TaxID=79880 RepID=UPI001C0C3687